MSTLNPGTYKYVTYIVNELCRCGLIKVLKMGEFSAFFRQVQSNHKSPHKRKAGQSERGRGSNEMMEVRLECCSQEPKNAGSP